MGGNPSEVDHIFCSLSTVDDGKKGPMFVEAKALEMEIEEDWWTLEDSFTEPVEKESRDTSLFHDVLAEVVVARVDQPPRAFNGCFRRQSLNEKGKKNVSFSSIHVRSYNVILGDHPCCVMGCPLALDWEYLEEKSLLMDEYEAARPHRRSRDELRTTLDKRREILVDYTDGDVRRVQRRLQRERSCRNKALASFFAPTTPSPLVRTPSCE